MNAIVHGRADRRVMLANDMKQDGTCEKTVPDRFTQFQTNQFTQLQTNPLAYLQHNYVFMYPLYARVLLPTAMDGSRGSLLRHLDLGWIQSHVRLWHVFESCLRIQSSNEKHAV